ncbi:MAG: c-type cytochrome [Deltaproteobacteria bacterium]|nr:c-type cytochrome [Deltaproteobacteria bacterium]
MKQFALIVGVSLFLVVTSHNLHAQDAKNGKIIFEQKCAQCHGAKGEVSVYGKAIRPFPTKDLRTNLLSDKEMRLIVKYGLYGRSMTGFVNLTLDPETRKIKKKLTYKEISDVIAYIRTLSYTPDILHGKTLFVKACHNCHMDPQGRELSQANDLEKSKLSREELVDVIKYGKHLKPMIAVRVNLTNVDIADIISYVLSIRK